MIHGEVFNAHGPHLHLAYLSFHFIYRLCNLVLKAVQAVFFKTFQERRT